MSALPRIPQRRSATEKFSVAPAPLKPVLCRRIEDASDALILLLDAADPDLDLKEGHDAEAIDEREPEDDSDPLDTGELDEAERSERSGHA